MPRTAPAHTRYITATIANLPQLAREYRINENKIRRLQAVLGQGIYCEDRRRAALNARIRDRNIAEESLKWSVVGARLRPLLIEWRELHELRDRLESGAAGELPEVRRQLRLVTAKINHVASLPERHLESV
jgi:hypothetical protein